MLIFLLLILYFIPSISAYSRKKKNASSILVVNLFLGWTFIGWIVALSWALSKDAPPAVVIKTAEASKNTASELAELFKLKQDGAITEDEFRAHKAKILG